MDDPHGPLETVADDARSQSGIWRHALDPTPPGPRGRGSVLGTPPQVDPRTEPSRPTTHAGAIPPPTQTPSPASPVPATADAPHPAAEPAADAEGPRHVADPNDLAIAVRGLRVAFSGKEVLHGVDVDAPRGGVLALVGPSGCGKTTLLRSINRLTELAPTASIGGRVLLDGSDIYGRGRDLNLLRRRIGMVFQQPNPFPMSIFENVAFAIREQARRRPTRRQLQPQVEEALRRAGLWDEVKDGLERNALSLSGGQQQRLCIARTLAADPEVILMDEPASALDPRSTARIEELIMQLAGSLTVIIVTHNLAQARRIADYAAFLLNGDLIEQGAASQVFSEPAHEETRGFIDGMFG